MTGLNTNGNRFVAKKFHESLPLPLPSEAIDLGERPLSILIATGPYSTSDNVMYEPLADLVNVIKVSFIILILDSINVTAVNITFLCKCEICVLYRKSLLMCVFYWGRCWILKIQKLKMGN